MASVWAKFGKRRQPVVRGIFGWILVGFGPGFRRSQAKCGFVPPWEGGEGLQEAWVRLGDEFRVVLEESRALVFCRRKRLKVWFLLVGF